MKNLTQKFLLIALVLFVISEMSNAQNCTNSGIDRVITSGGNSPSKITLDGTNDFYKAGDIKLETSGGQKGGNILLNAGPGSEGGDIILECADGSEDCGSIYLIPGSNGIYTDGTIKIGSSSSNTSSEIDINGNYTTNGFMKATKFVDHNNAYYYLNPSDQNTSLRVAGKIVSKEIQVVHINTKDIETNSVKANEIFVDVENVADYVFKDDYNLLSLDEVDRYVKEHKHLPGIPSGSELEDTGMNVSVMNNLLLEKIEELTLYVIELKKENEVIKDQLNSLSEL